MKMINKELFDKTIFEWRNVPMANYICPATMTLMHESISPRGYCTLIANYDNETVTEDVKRKIEDRIDTCVMCRLCQFKGMDDTSVPDAIAWFRGNKVLISEENEENEIIHEKKSEDSVLVVECDYLEKVRNKDNVSLLVIPDLMKLYNEGAWNKLEKYSEKIEKEIKDYKEIIVMSSAEKYLFESVLQLEINGECRTIWSKSGVNNFDEKVIAVPAIPERLTAYSGAFNDFLNKAGFTVVNTPIHNATLEPKYFASLSGSQFKKGRENIFKWWGKNLDYYCEIYNCSTIVFESVKAAEMYKKYGQQKAISLNDILK